MRNTKEKALLHFAIIPGQKKGWYLAICFELGLIEEGKDIFNLRDRINKVSREYFKIVQKDDELSDDLLNQSLPKKYDKLLEKIKEEIKSEKLRKEWEDRINKILMWRQAILRGDSKSPVKV